MGTASVRANARESNASPRTGGIGAGRFDKASVPAVERWPADRFYWAILETPLRGPGSSPGVRGLSFLFEPFTPQPCDEVGAVFRRLGRAGPSRRWLACGLDRRELERARDTGALSLTPESIPPFLGATGLRAQDIELLSGGLEPPCLRRSRFRRAIMIAVVAVTASVLLVVGAERRASAFRAASRADEARAAEIVALVLREQAGTEIGQSPGLAADLAELRLVAEQRRLTRAAGLVRAGAADFDAAGELGVLLSAWPAGVVCRTESLMVTADSITIVAVVPDHAAAQSLAGALSGLRGWGPASPATRAEGGEVRATIRLARAAGAAP